MTVWKKGDDYKNKDAAFRTFGINKVGEDLYHTNAIEVYTNAKDRDIIIKLLNKHKEGH